MIHILCAYLHRIVNKRHFEIKIMKILLQNFRGRESVREQVQVKYLGQIICRLEYRRYNNIETCIM